MPTKISAPQHVLCEPVTVNTQMTQYMFCFFEPHSNDRVIVVNTTTVYSSPTFTNHGTYRFPKTCHLPSTIFFARLSRAVALVAPQKATPTVRARRCTGGVRGSFDAWPCGEISWGLVEWTMLKYLLITST